MLLWRARVSLLHLRDGVVPSGVACDFVVRTGQVSWDLPCGVFVVANREFQGPGAAACRQPVSTCVLLPAGVARGSTGPEGGGCKYN